MGVTHKIGFPGIGINEFTVNRVAFELFGMKVYWYGILITLGIMGAFLYFSKRGKKTEGLLEDDIFNVTIFAVPIGIVGARLMFVLTHLEDYNTFASFFQIRNGGLAIYGGIIFGGLTFLLYCRMKKLNPLKFLDAVAPGVMIGQAIGRWGNFINGEAYGWTPNVKNWIFRMTVDGRAVHPTFFYEFLWSVMGFILINVAYKKKKFNGQIVTLYLGWYGIGRAFIELLRTDSCMFLKNIIGSDPLDVFGTASDSGIKLFVYLGVLLTVGSVALYIYLFKKSNKEDEELKAFEESFSLDKEREKDTAEEVKKEENNNDIA